MACLDHQALGQPGQEGANDPPGSGADNGPPVQPGSNPTAVMTG